MCQPNEAIEAEKFFDSSSIVYFNQKQEPMDLVGSLIVWTEGANKELVWNYIPIFTTEELDKIVPKYNSEILWQKTVTKDVAVKLRFLKFLELESKDQLYLNVVLEDLYSVKVNSYSVDKEIRKKVIDQLDALKQLGCKKVEYCDKVNLSTVKTKLYESHKKSGGMAYIDGHGDTYYENGDYTLKKIISLHTIPVDLNSLSYKKDLKDINGFRGWINSAPTTQEPAYIAVQKETVFKELNLNRLGVQQVRFVDPRKSDGV
jgi:hypothetical protein